MLFDVLQRANHYFCLWCKKKMQFGKWICLILENGGRNEQYRWEATIIMKPRCSTMHATLQHWIQVHHHVAETLPFKVRKRLSMRQEVNNYIMPTGFPSAIRLSANCSTKILVSQTTKRDCQEQQRTILNIPSDLPGLHLRCHWCGYLVEVLLVRSFALRVQLI